VIVSITNYWRNHRRLSCRGVHAFVIVVIALNDPGTPDRKANLQELIAQKTSEQARRAPVQSADAKDSEVVEHASYDRIEPCTCARFDTATRISKSVTAVNVYACHRIMRV
jgi:hypothetical protein